MALTKIGTDGFKDDAVTLAKQAGGTDGQIITYDASGNPTTVGPGTDGQVLTSTGAGSPPAFEAIPAGVGGATGVDFNDDVKARFGTGNDLELYHNGTHSFITNATNDLTIECETNDGALVLKANNISLKDDSDQFFFKGIETTGAVELYYGNVKKFETTSAGTQTFGDAQFEGNDGTDNALKWDKSDDSLYFRDNYKAQFGTGGDLQIYHDGTASRIHSGSHPLYMRTGGQWGVFKGDGSESMIVAEPDGEVKLYYDNTKFLETSADGVKIGTGSAGRLEVNSGAAELAWWNDNTADGTYIKFWQTSSGANTIGSISHNSTSTSYNTSSDYRLKENATAISDGITRLKTLKPYRFNFKVTPDEIVDGFFAHEVTAVPEAITGTKDQVDADGNIDPQSIDQSKLVPLLTAALQEEIGKREALEARVAALEAT